VELPWKEHRVEDKLAALRRVERVVREYLGPNALNYKPVNPKSIPEYEMFNESVRVRLDEMKIYPDRPLVDFIKGLIEYANELEQTISLGARRKKYLDELIDRQKEEIANLRSKHERSPDN